MGRFLFKRKASAAIKEPSKKASKKKALAEEEVFSDDDFSDNEARVLEYSDGEYEDVQAKAHRQAKELLKSLESEAKDEETGEVDTEAIAHRLEEDALVKSHRLHRELADSLIIEDDATSAFTVHRYSVIAAVLCPKGRYIVSCGKDGIIAKYDTETDEVRRIQYFHKNADNHKGSINALAISPDSKWLVTGGADNLIKIWDFETLRHVHEFRGHRGEVTSLVFRLDSSSELFSGSKDRSVKAWNLDQFGYVDTSYGHQDAVAQIDMLRKPRVLSIGCHDKTARFWKIDTESQLIFNGHKHSISIDTCALINEDHFVTGSADGSLCIWSVAKKKPVTTVREAHGKTDDCPNWIVSVAAAKYSDLIASGSCDGWIRFWKVSADYKAVTEMQKFQQDGFINDIKFSLDNTRLIVSCGQEHKCGRWWKIANGRNIILDIDLAFGEKTKAVTEGERDSDKG